MSVPQAPAFALPLCLPTSRGFHPALSARRAARAPPARAPRRRRARRGAVAPRAAALPDYYGELGIDTDADAAAVKRAYRRAALKNHPDVSDAPDARERFLRVQEAYAVLSDASKRADYDRRRRFSDFDFDAPGGWGGGGGADSGFDASEFARRWRENNPMPEDINDSLGSIFSDLFSDVSDKVGSADGAKSKASGVMEDLIDFLEKRVEPFTTPAGSSSTGTSASTKSSSTTSKSSARSTSRRDSNASANTNVDNTEEDDDDEELLRSGSEPALAAEVDDARAVVAHLRARATKARADEDGLRARARDWDDRAARADARRDYATRDAAREQRVKVAADAARFARRGDDAMRAVARQEARLERLEQRLDELRSGVDAGPSSSQQQQKRREQKRARDEPPRAERDARDDRVGRDAAPRQTAERTTKKSSAGAGAGRADASKGGIDDELEAMKRELGL